MPLVGLGALAHHLALCVGIFIAGLLVPDTGLGLRAFHHLELEYHRARAVVASLGGPAPITLGPVVATPVVYAVTASPVSTSIIVSTPVPIQTVFDDLRTIASTARPTWSAVVSRPVARVVVSSAPRTSLAVIAQPPRPSPSWLRALSSIVWLLCAPFVDLGRFLAARVVWPFVHVADPLVAIVVAIACLFGIGTASRICHPCQSARALLATARTGTFGISVSQLARRIATGLANLLERHGIKSDAQIAVEKRLATLDAQHVSLEIKYLGLEMKHVAVDVQHVGLKTRHAALETTHAMLAGQHAASRELNVVLYAFLVVAARIAVRLNKTRPLERADVRKLRVQICALRTEVCSQAATIVCLETDFADKAAVIDEMRDNLERVVKAKNARIAELDARIVKQHERIVEQSRKLRSLESVVAAVGERMVELRTELADSAIERRYMALCVALDNVAQQNDTAVRNLRAARADRDTSVRGFRTQTATLRTTEATLQKAQFDIARLLNSNRVLDKHKADLQAQNKMLANEKAALEARLESQSQTVGRPRGRGQLMIAAPGPSTF